MSYVINQNRVGITERGDAGLDLSWADRLQHCLFAILITKNPNDKFISKVLTVTKPIIVHITCTGWGGTELEPHVPSPKTVYRQVLKLVDAGFPPERLVLRIDPIISTAYGFRRVKLVADLFKDTDITRLRYSFLDVYPHVKERFEAAGLQLPYESFGPPKYAVKDTLVVLEELEKRWHLEACAEDTPHKVGCVSHLDFEVLGLDPALARGKSTQRKACLCVANKFELLTTRGRCPHGCLYCYWK